MKYSGILNSCINVTYYYRLTRAHDSTCVCLVTKKHYINNIDSIL